MNYDVEYAIACSEVLEILKYIKKEDVSKIPQEEIKILESNAKVDYVCKYDPTLDVKEQKISKMAKTIIAIYFIDYVANIDQKRRIELKQKKDLELIEIEKKELYGYEKMFNNASMKNINNSNQDIALIKDNNENFLKKIYKKVKNILKKIKFKST